MLWNDKYRASEEKTAKNDKNREKKKKYENKLISRERNTFVSIQKPLAIVN
jgi:hypothetical protein